VQQEEVEQETTAIVVETCPGGEGPAAGNITPPPGSLVEAAGPLPVTAHIDAAPEDVGVAQAPVSKQSPGSHVVEVSSVGSMEKKASPGIQGSSAATKPEA